MLKLFRHIRLNLLLQGQTSNYLKYAIGEIILVVIGVLIALQINNWNEQRKDLGKEKQILVQLKSEYENNLVQLEEKVKMREQAIISAFNILKSIDDPKDINEDDLLNNMWILL